MRSPSIYEFRNALCLPYKMLSTLKGIEPDIATLTRSKYFAECHIRDNHRRTLLYAPIDKRSIQMLHHANLALNRAYDSGFIRMDILNNEMLRLNTSAMRVEHEDYCTLAIERLPEGDPLEVVINTMSRAELLQGLERLDDELRRYDISHNNLTLRNIIVDTNNRWLPIRQYYTQRGYGNDATAIESLRKEIIKYTTPSTDVDLSRLAPWCDMPNINDYGLHEGRRQRVTSRGIGFEDEYGKLVIEDKYLKVSDFMEGRATITTMDMKMGVIDRSGREIIEPIYDNVIYSEKSGKSVVVCGDKCAIFDYHGKQISEWRDMV